MTKNQLPALNWIIDFLEQSDIPYVVCGGLAAQAYGASRQLNDIDLYVPSDKLDAVVKHGAPYVTYGPEHHVGAQWDLTYVKFDYHGQDVEVGSDKNCKILDHRSSKWVTKNISFENYERKEIYGVAVRVMAKNDLVAYKKLLNREVDIDDVTQIDANL